MPHIALHGFGRWAPNILRDLLILGCEVTVVVRPDGPSEARARAAGVPFASAPPPGVDGVVVATSAVSHRSVVESVLDLGVPVYVEKPMTAGSVDARALVAAARDRVFVMDKWRYHPGVEALRDLVASGEIGTLVGISCIRDGGHARVDDTDTLWRHLPHDLTIALEIAGSLPEPTAAVAELTAGEPTGLQGVLAGPPWVTVRHSSVVSPWRREVRVSCTDGVAWLADGYEDHIAVVAGYQRQDVEPDLRPIDREWPLVRELRAFLEHLAGGPPPRSSAAEGLMVVERMEQLRALAGLDG